jgi:hypothetical protein
MAHPAVVLPTMIVVSTVVRSLVAVRHSVPRIFPDEYIYTALARSIGHGHLQIRGVTSYFPAVLEPALAAPIWRFFSTVTAYHGVQIENAFAASLAAIPVYVLARWLGLRQPYSYACALYSLLLPTLVVAGYMLTDLVAYPLALASVAVGARALNDPTRRRQLAFLLLAALTTLARVQYFVLVPAYLAAAAVVDRRRMFRAHRVAIVAVIPAALLAVIGLVAYYSPGTHGVYDLHYVGWVFKQAFLFAIVTGVVMVPGAVAAAVSPRGRRETAAAAFVCSVVLLLLAETSTVAARTGSFKERYLFELMPLVPIWFGLYLKNGRPRRRLVLALAAGVAIAAMRMPISAYSAAGYKLDSQFLFAVSYLEERVGIGSASLLIAVLATVGAVAAVIVAFGRFARAAVVGTLAVAIIASVAAVTVDLRGARAVRNQLPHDLTWVDEMANGTVTAVATPLSLKQDLIESLFWNTSIQREVRLDSAIPTDIFSAPKLAIDRDGTLRNATRELLVDNTGSTLIFANGRLVGRDRPEHLTLWRTPARPRLRLVVEGRFFDSWLAPRGRLRAWPLTDTGSGTAVSFRLTLPRSVDGRRIKGVMHLRFGPTRFVLGPGVHVDVVCRASSGALNVGFWSKELFRDPTFRPLTVKLTRLHIADGADTRVSRASAPCTRTG